MENSCTIIVYTSEISPFLTYASMQKKYNIHREDAASTSYLLHQYLRRNLNIFHIRYCINSLSKYILNKKPTWNKHLMALGEWINDIIGFNCYTKDEILSDMLRQGKRLLGNCTLHEAHMEVTLKRMDRKMMAERNQECLLSKQEQKRTSVFQTTTLWKMRPRIPIKA